MDAKKLAAEILEVIGGKENVSNAAHCMTRLRVDLIDESKTSDEKIKAVKGVIGVAHSGTQTQIIIGQGVDQVYDEFCKLGSFETKPAIDEQPDKKKLTPKSILDNILGAVSGSLTPVLPVFIVAGIFKMIAVLFGPKNFGLLTEESDLYILCNLVNDACYYFLPFMVAYSAAKKFKANPIYAMIVAAVGLHSTFTTMVSEGTAFTIYGIPVTMISYAQAVFPIIINTWVLSIVEKYVKKIVPNIMRTIGG